MGRKTREYEAAFPDRLLSIFQPRKGGEPVWLSPKEFRAIARAVGFSSNATFQKTRNRLLIAGILAHDGKYYHLRDPGWFYDMRNENNSILPGVEVDDEEGLRQALQRVFVWAFHSYAGMLRELVRVEDSVKAREMISLHFTTGLIGKDMLIELARVIWEHRKKVPLEALDTVLLNISLRKDRQGRLVYLRRREK